jgi:DNA primase
LNDQRDEIRARVDIVDLVSRRVALKRSGKNYTGLCPFHEDRNPSFFVNPQTGRYRCWSCGESGDVFTWVMKTEHVEFADALKELAEIAGVKLKRGQARPPASLRETHRRAMAEALAFFIEQLPKAGQASEYCNRRGLDEETLRQWEIGFAPDAGEALAVRLKKAGVPLVEGKSLFLVDQDASGGFFDRFRGRLMFPIRDEKGDLVAFGGRLLGDGSPKYINSSDTPLYHKSRVLYGMHKARDPMSKRRTAVLVEGYLDVIACHRSGVETAVASLGTALSEEHAKLLKRWVEEVAILYDSDEAGQKAADRAIGILEAEGIRVRVALMPQGEDPDTLLRSAGPEAVKASVDAGVTPATFRLSALERRLAPNQEQFWDEVQTILATCQQSLEVERHITRLAPLYPGLRDVTAAQKQLRRIVSNARGEGPRRKAADRPHSSTEFVPLSEPLSTLEVVVFSALHEPEFRRAAWMTIAHLPEVFSTGAGVFLARSVAEAFPLAPPEGPVLDWIDAIEPESSRQLLSDVQMDFRGNRLTEHVVVDAIRRLKREAGERELRRLKQGDMTAEERQQIQERWLKLRGGIAVPEESSSTDPFA